MNPREASQGSIDRFIDAVWIEDGLSANTLAAYRRDLSLYGDWLARTHERELDSTREADLLAYSVARHAGSKASSLSVGSASVSCSPRGNRCACRRP